MTPIKRILPSGNLRWQINYHDSSGKRIRKLYLTKEEAEIAEAALKTRSFETKLFGSKHPAPRTFEELCKMFLEFSYNNKARKTFLSHSNSLIPLLDWFGGRFIDTLTALDVEQYKAVRMEFVSPASVNRELACLRYMFNLAIEWEWYNGNLPKRIKLLKEPPSRIRYLTREEATRLLACCRSPHMKVFYAIALLTGMRKGEIFGLSWDNIDWERRIINVIEQIDTNEGPKQGSRREIPLCTQLEEILLGWLTIQSPSHVLVMGGRRECRNAHKNICRRAGINDLRVHDLRHTAASWMVQDGTPLPVVGEILGHKDYKITLKYAHFAPGQKNTAVIGLGIRWAQIGHTPKTEIQKDPPESGNSEIGRLTTNQ